jgi:hypothetical protein
MPRDRAFIFPDDTISPPRTRMETLGVSNLNNLIMVVAATHRKARKQNCYDPAFLTSLLALSAWINFNGF